MAGIGMGVGLGAGSGRTGCGGASAASLPTLAFANAVARAEGASGTTVFSFTLQLSRHGSTTAIPFTWSVAGTGSGPAHAADFAGGVLPSGSGVFASGETAKAIAVAVAGDSAVEPDEGFTVTAAASLPLVPATSVGAIVNDDAASTTLSPLALSSTSFSTGGVTSVGITGQSAGSTVTASSSDGTVLTLSDTTLSGSFAGAGSPTITLVETLAGAVNSPCTTTVGVTVAAAGAGPIALNTPLITVGPSIQNVVNMRSPRTWLLAHAKGHFYPTPGTNAALGGACATAEGAQKQGLPANHYREPAVRLPFVLNQLGDPAVRGRVLVQYDPGPNDLADIANDGSTTHGVTAAKLIAAMDAWIKDVVTDRGHMIAVCAIAISASSQSNPHAAAVRNAYNQAAAQRHDPAAGVFYCGSRLATFDGFSEGGSSWTSLTYDGTLHPNARGADLIGLADYSDLAPYFGPGSALRTTGTPFGQAANTQWSMTGSGGTLATGASGTVASGWTAACTTSAVNNSGAAIGVTAACTAGGTRDFVVNGQTLTLPCQQIDVVGTPTADGFLRFETTAGVVKGAGAAANFNTGEFGQAVLAVEVAGSTQADPAGVASIGFQYGLLGGAMNKTVDANTGLLAKARQLVFRTVPVVSLKVNGAQKPEFACGFKTGVTVNLRVWLASLDCRQVELVAYAPPHNLSTAFVASGGTNPLAPATKPSLSGTFTAGNTLPIATSTLSGGGAGLYGATTIRDTGDAVLATIANTAATYAWASTAGDSGKTVRASVAAANSYGAATFDGPNYPIA
jgi:hypothetical protein